jgi:hypothetical protein
MEPVKAVSRPCASLVARLDSGVRGGKDRAKISFKSQRLWLRSPPN